MPAGTSWHTPHGGMFFWLRLPEGLDAVQLLEAAVAAGVAYVPGAPFYAHAPDARAVRLSFVTLSPADIADGVAALGRVLHEALSTVALAAP
jgi:2-aminoadipate transaminase